MFTVSSCFIGKFKIGDNVNYNLMLLRQLYQYFDAGTEEQKNLLRKPIIILNITIIEAFLYDLHFRARWHTAEGIINIPSEWLQSLLGKNVDEFGKCIDRAKKYKIFGQNEDDRFYEGLHELRKIRNRIHIQNAKGELEADDVVVFSQQRKIASEKALEKVAKYFAANYPRPNHIHGYVGDFQFPWREHLRG